MRIVPFMFIPSTPFGYFQFRFIKKQQFAAFIVFGIEYSVLGVTRNTKRKYFLLSSLSVLGFQTNVPLSSLEFNIQPCYFGFEYTVEHERNLIYKLLVYNGLHEGQLLQLGLMNIKCSSLCEEDMPFPISQSLHSPSLNFPLC